MEALVKRDSLSLWEIEAELREAFDRYGELKDAGGSQEDISVALSILQEYVLAEKGKIDKCSQFLTFLENTECNIEKEVERLKSKQGRIEGTRNAMCSYILACMERAGLDKIEGKLSTFKAKKNPPAVEIFDELAIAPEFLVQPPPPPPKPDKNAIKEALKRGQEVEGARLISKKRLVIE